MNKLTQRALEEAINSKVPKSPSRRAVQAIAPSHRKASVILPSRGSGIRGGALRKRHAPHTNKSQLRSQLPVVNEELRNEDLRVLDVDEAFGGVEDDIAEADCQRTEGTASDWAGSEPSSPRMRHGGGAFSVMSSRSSSRASTVCQAPKGMLVALADADKPMPFKPFCQKCAPLRPTDCLCLNPQDLSEAWVKFQASTQSHNAAENVDARRLAEARRVSSKTSTRVPISTRKSDPNGPKEVGNGVGSVAVVKEAPDVAVRWMRG